jgi:hypothetical protein
MALYFHFIGSEAGFGEDRRWQKLGSDYFQWAKNTRCPPKARRSLANIGIVMGQSTLTFLSGSRSAHTHDYMRETTQGIYATCLTARFAFDFVHEDRLDLDGSANTVPCFCQTLPCLATTSAGRSATTSDPEGSIMASFETSLYDENLQRRQEFALSDLLGN